MNIITYTWLEKKFEASANLSKEEKRMVQDYLARKHALVDQGFDPIIDVSEAQKMAVELDAIGV